MKRWRLKKIFLDLFVLPVSSQRESWNTIRLMRPWSDFTRPPIPRLQPGLLKSAESQCLPVCNSLNASGIKSYHSRVLLGFTSEFSKSLLPPYSIFWSTRSVSLFFNYCHPSSQCRGRIMLWLSKLDLGLRTNTNDLGSSPLSTPFHIHFYLEAAVLYQRCLNTVWALRSNGFAGTSKSASVTCVDEANLPSEPLISPSESELIRWLLQI